MAKKSRPTAQDAASAEQTVEREPERGAEAGASATIDRAEFEELAGRVTALERRLRHMI